ncbi:hypothetical protein SAMN05216270_1093 [Glycomyces harbinensis]|uniref:Uncharacterized protein n=1 Tax=Glycomyces harbinensis TaxID=58114 RepID=A0A1G6YIQ0_9ACTN|nr:hypothetical protein SAMN05216270_1093 [Glycomyces harbinensis]
MILLFKLLAVMVVILTCAFFFGILFRKGRGGR